MRNIYFHQKRKCRTLIFFKRLKPTSKAFLFFFFFLFSFFLISNKDIYSRKLPYAKKHKAARKIQIGKNKKREKRKEKILNTKERAKEHSERVTRGDSPSPRPVK